MSYFIHFFLKKKKAFVFSSTAVQQQQCSHNLSLFQSSVFLLLSLLLFNVMFVYQLNSHMMRVWPMHEHTHTQTCTLFSDMKIKHEAWAGHKTSPDRLLFMSLLCYEITRNYLNCISLPSAYMKKTCVQFITHNCCVTLTTWRHVFTKQYVTVCTDCAMCLNVSAFQKENVFIMTSSLEVQTTQQRVFPLDANSAKAPWK